MIDLINQPIVVKATNSLLDYALANEADNIYLEQVVDSKNQATKHWLARYKIYGNLGQAYFLPADLAVTIIARLKFLANINQRHKIGNFKINRHYHPIICQLTSLKVDHGEKIVINFKTKPALAYSLPHLGMNDYHLEMLKKALLIKRGIIMVAGESVVGKTSTAYSILEAINSPQVNIYTIEQPVKTNINSLNQIEFKENLNINTTLRYCSQQGADVLYLNTLPNNLDMHILKDLAHNKLIILSRPAKNMVDAMSGLHQKAKELMPYLNLVINQKLAKTVCQNCSQEHKLDHYILEDLHNQFDLEDTKTLRRATFAKGQGCNYCNYTGYGYQTGIFEMLPIDQETKKLISQSELSSIIKRKIKNKIELNILDHAFDQAINHRIPIAEIQRLF